MKSRNKTDLPISTYVLDARFLRFQHLKNKNFLLGEFPEVEMDDYLPSLPKHLVILKPIKRSSVFIQFSLI